MLIVFYQAQGRIVRSVLDLFHFRCDCGQVGKHYLGVKKPILMGLTEPLLDLFWIYPTWVDKVELFRCDHECRQVEKDYHGVQKPMLIGQTRSIVRFVLNLSYLGGRGGTLQM